MVSNCKHEVTITKKYVLVCLHCGEILEDVPCFLIESHKYMTKEVKQIDNIYTEISSLLSEKKLK